MDGWQTGSVGRRWASAGIITGPSAFLLAAFLAWPSSEPVDRSGQPSQPAISSSPAPDLQALRTEAWERIGPSLDEADRRAADQIPRSLSLVHDFLDQRAAGSREFAAVLLSMRGKWAFVKSKLPYADSDAHFKFLNESFERHVFTSDELRRVIESAVSDCVTSVQGIENELLVRIRTDLGESELAGLRAVPGMHADAAFHDEYERMLAQAADSVSRELRVDVARELGSLAAGEIAAVIAVRVAIAVSTRLGISAGILGAGAAASWATFGVALVAAIVADITIDWVLKLAGYDPEGRLAEKVNATLDRVRTLLLSGDPEAHALNERLRRLQQEDPTEQGRAALREAADRIEASGSLGLEHELERLNTLRSQLRREALRRLILQGGRP